MSLDESVIYQLMESINQLKKEMEKLKEEIKDLRTAVSANTFELLKNSWPIDEFFIYCHDK